MTVTNDIKYIGVNDKNLTLFEAQFPLENGMAFNSYMIIDDKIAVLDSVDEKYGDDWLENIEIKLNGRTPDYLIVQHMEPDHSSNISAFINKYPDAVVVSNAKTFKMIDQFFGEGLCKNTLTVANGDTLSLGKHELTFVFAPMVHWPEVMLTYDSTDKVLFSADAFGKFGTVDADEDWACEARRYYFGIVGKYGTQVQAVLKKAKELEIDTICPLHGPVLNENLEYYLNLYDIWSSYGVETDGVFIAYSSVYGNTEKAAELLKEELLKNGCPKVAMGNLVHDDINECVEDAFRYGKIVLATTTYNGDVFPVMKHFIDMLVEKNYQNRIIGLIENGTWAATAGKKMKAMLENSKNITFCENSVTIKSALNDENKAQIELLAKELA